MRDYLKTKCMSLASESKIIRKLERSRLKRARQAMQTGKGNAEYNYMIFHGLRQHRVNDVRDEARHSNLAYGFLRGHSYHDIEQKAFKQPNWDRVLTMIRKYGEGDKESLITKFKDWKNQA